MPVPIPPTLAPYLRSSLRSNSNALVTSVLETPATWLTVRLLKAALSGVEDEVENYGESSSGHPVIFVSVLRPIEFWVELSKKIGLDTTSANSKQSLVFVDCLSGGLNVSQSSAKVVKSKSLSMNDIKQAIETARSTSLQLSHTSQRQPVIIIDGLDFVHASHPEIGAAALTTFVTELRETFSAVALTIAADAPLLFNFDDVANPLEVGHSALVRSIAHQSNWVIQLRPLDTGHARDVSGIIQISRGGADGSDVDDDGDGDDNDKTLTDGEWLYQMKGDGSVRVWSRGE